MKILVYSHTFAPRLGGVETIVMTLARGLSAASAGQGHEPIEVTVATPVPRGDFDDAPLPFRVVRRPGFWGLLRLLRSADLIHLAGPALLPLFLALILRRPVVVEHHGYQAICPNGLLLIEPTQTVCPGHFQARRYRKCWECNRASEGPIKSFKMLLLTFPRRWMCGRLARNISVTDHVRRRLQLPRSEVIYHGISTASPSSSSILEPPPASAPLCFGYIGRLVSEKGLPLVLESVKELDRRGYKFHLKLIGDGPERARLEALTDSLNLRSRVTFTGYLQGDRLELALRDIHALVLPSICEETAGLAAMEQMMRGKLVIVSDIGGLGEVVDRAGLKFPAGNVPALTSCLERVLNSPSLAGEIGFQARQRALALFSQGTMIERHVNLYEQVVSSKG